MTNGEKFKEIFSITQVDEGELYAYAWLPNHNAAEFSIDWWNAEYKEPTTRNCSGCKYAKDNHNAGTEECHLCMWESQYTPTNKNDLPHCQHTDEEIAKSFIEDVETVKDQLPCGQMMDFPKSFDDFVKDYGFKDKKEIYTNGSELIQVFRVKQWLEHISTTKNDLGVDGCIHKCIDKPTEDCISREQAIEWVDNLRKMDECFGNHKGDYYPLSEVIDRLQNVPSVTPQLSSGLEKNSKLEKIRDQLKSNLRGVEITLEVLVENDPLRPKMEGAKTTLEDCLELIDKAEAESI